MHNKCSKGLSFRIASLVALAVLAACGGGSSVPGRSLDEGSRARSTASGVLTTAARYGWKVLDYHPQSGRADDSVRKRDTSPASTLPYYTSFVSSPVDGNTYMYQIVGTNPQTTKAVTKISVVPILLKIKYPDGTVLDPSQPACGDMVSVGNRVFDGPNFVATSQTSNGINVGTVQLIDAHMRAEFWEYAKNSNYHVEFSQVKAPVVLTFTPQNNSFTGMAKTFAGTCAGTAHRFGTVDINQYDSFLQNVIRQYATVTQLPVIVTYNLGVSIASSGGYDCCVLGYHSSLEVPAGTQFYANATWVDPGNFPFPTEDINDLNHELGEFVNDPWGTNGTPAWGDTGQVPDGDCQNNLEVGDPLTGSYYNVVLNGYTYHPQELTFFDWFFRTPSRGTGGLYSFEGSFTSNAGPVCVAATPTPLPTP